jgi:hypothetical protein
MDDVCTVRNACSVVCSVATKHGLNVLHNPMRIVLPGSNEPVQAGPHFDLNEEVLKAGKQTAEGRVRKRRFDKKHEVTE